MYILYTYVYTHIHIQENQGPLRSPYFDQATDDEVSVFTMAVHRRGEQHVEKSDKRIR